MSQPQKMWDRHLLGKGVDRTLDRIAAMFPDERTCTQIPSGTDLGQGWIVPDEWICKKAEINGNPFQPIIYSQPIRVQRLDWADLLPHLFTIMSRLPALPVDTIPYRTSYYKKNWGFCVTKRDVQRVIEKGGWCAVEIDAELKPGHMSYLELDFPGWSKEPPIVFTTYVCHPEELWNDNTSGVLLATALASYIKEKYTYDNRKYSYKFIFMPETLGSIAWLSRNTAPEHSMHITCVGRKGIYYKEPHRPGGILDKAVKTALIGKEHTMDTYYPWGSDERHFTLAGSMAGLLTSVRPYDSNKYPEYHTSADKEVSGQEDMLKLYMEVIDVLEKDREIGYRRCKGEPFGISFKHDDYHRAFAWALVYADGKTLMSEVCQAEGIGFKQLRRAVQDMEEQA